MTFVEPQLGGSFILCWGLRAVKEYDGAQGAKGGQLWWKDHEDVEVGGWR